MKEFLTFTGNQFREAVAQALLLGYKPFEMNPSYSTPPNFAAVYLRGDRDGYLFWYSETRQEISVVLGDFLEWKVSDVQEKKPAYEFATGQWVVVNDKVQGWKLNIYSHRSSYLKFPHACISGNWSPEAILPYEGNEHLLETFYSH